MVALLAEGVDRNSKEDRRTVAAIVALLAEGVDRNMQEIVFTVVDNRRPPRGGRG